MAQTRVRSITFRAANVAFAAFVTLSAALPLGAMAAPEPLPDLHVAEARIDLSRRQAIYTVENVGTGPARSFVSTVSAVGGTSSPSPYPILELAAGARQTISVPLPGYPVSPCSVPGLISFDIAVDTGQSVVESNETNNQIRARALCPEPPADTRTR
jgi:hypothetical protein